MIRALIRIARALPREIDRLWLMWALAEIDPMHRDVPYIILRLNCLERTKA